MKTILPSFLLLFIFTTAINAQQKIGFKIILDQNFKYLDVLVPVTEYRIDEFYKRNSRSYGLTYEKVLSNKFLLSLETGLYLNTQSSSSNVKYDDYFSDNELHTYTLKRKITELHIPILIKKYFYIKSALFFVSAGPKLALTLSDKTSYKDENDNSILMKINNFDTSFDHPSRFYLINPLNYNLGFEYKKVQISTSYALFNIRNLHNDYYPRLLISDRTVLLSLSIGYML